MIDLQNLFPDMPTNGSSPSWDAEYAVAADLTPEELTEALSRPEAPVARYLVAELTGVDNPSPTLIIETITALNNSQSQSQPQPQPQPQPSHVQIEQHQPGINDLMMGATHPAFDRPHTAQELASVTQDDNDSTVCRYDFQLLADHMPHKLFGVRDLRPLNLFHVSENIKYLPDGYQTTTLGLKTVWMEVFRGQEQAVYDDEQLLSALLKVGGLPRPQDVPGAIVYPEDLVPCASPKVWDSEHWRFWEQLGDLATTSW